MVLELLGEHARDAELGIADDGELDVDGLATDVDRSAAGKEQRLAGPDQALPEGRRVHRQRQQVVRAVLAAIGEEHGTVAGADAGVIAVDEITVFVRVGGRVLLQLEGLVALGEGRRENEADAAVLAVHQPRGELVALQLDEGAGETLIVLPIGREDVDHLDQHGEQAEQEHPQGDDPDQGRRRAGHATALSM